MDNNEAKEFFRCVVLKECSDKIRLKCRDTHLIGVDDNRIRDLNELIKQFLALRKIWDAMPYDKD